MKIFFLEMRHFAAPLGRAKYGCNSYYFFKPPNKSHKGNKLLPGSLLLNYGVVSCNAHLFDYCCVYFHTVSNFC